MDPQHPTSWDWLAMHQAPLPPDLLHQSLPSGLAAYLQGVDARLHRLALLVEAMREQLEEAGLFSEAQLMARVQAIDLRDGTADGRNTPTTRCRCNQCGRISAGPRRRCLYCGSEDLVKLG